MKKTPELTYGLDDLDRAVDHLYTLLPSCKVLTFTGPLGAGKTTLIQALLKRCGVEQDVVSPTFTYLNIYKNKEGEQFNHFDLYRLNTAKEFTASGFNEYLHLPDSYTLIEWPEKIVDLLDNTVCHVVLEYVDQDTRRMKVSCS